MQATLAELATLVEGELIGSGDVVVVGAAPLGEAGPGQITLIDRVERAGRLANTEAAAAVAPRTFQPNGLPIIRVDNVHRAFASIVTRFTPPRTPRRIGVSPLAAVSPSARIGRDVDIHAHATIGEDVEIGDRTTIHSGVQVLDGSKIGPDVTIFPNAVLYENTIIGTRCVIHAGAVLGAYGFGYSLVDGRHQLTAQLGNVVLGDDVEVGAGTTIDRGTYGATSVGEGTKIDNLVMIGHNCRIGKYNLLCAQVGIAGSTTTGDYVVMAGQVGVRDHVRVGDRAVLGAMSGVMNDVSAGARMLGIPATPEREQFVQMAALGKLPEMRRQVRKLQATVDKLVEQLGEAVAKDERQTTKNGEP